MPARVLRAWRRFRGLISGQEVCHTEEKWLYTYLDGDICHSDLCDDSAQEVVLVNNPSFVPVKEKVVMGKTFYKEDVEKALAFLSPVEE